MKCVAKYALMVLALCAGASAVAQTPAVAPDSAKVTLRAAVAARLSKAADLRREYRFSQALAVCEAAAKADSTISVEDEIMLCRNGMSMLEYCSRPVVIAREKFSIDEFFLYYPLPEKSWRAIPNILDTIPSPVVKATFIPQGQQSLIFSAPDAEGIRNLLKIEKRDSVWSAPELLGEQLTSSGAEIYPMLSSDGKTLFFASSGLFGAGGYDLYSSQWNEQTREWDTPVNMGFPYSSPADDFLFVNTPDDKYSIFASNRDCSPDSVYVYVLEYDSMPVRTSFEEGSDEIRQLAALLPDNASGRVDNRGAMAVEVAENEKLREYVANMKEVQAFRDTLEDLTYEADSYRARFASASNSEKDVLREKIVAIEAKHQETESSLGLAVSKLQNLEMEIILSGSVIDPDAVKALADREVKGAGTAYAFSRRQMGESLEMKVQKPKSNFDYSFMVLPEGRFAEDNTLPEGLVYQIQLFSASRPATVAKLRGLSPVFSRNTSAGAIVYSVGVFRTYTDVLSKLNAVKKAGFRSAFIVAFNNGEQVTIAKAKQLEKPNNK